MRDLDGQSLVARDVKKAIIIIIEFLRDDDVAKARALHHLDQKGQIRHVIQCETTRTFPLSNTWASKSPSVRSTAPARAPIANAPRVVARRVDLPIFFFFFFFFFGVSKVSAWKMMNFNEEDRDVLSRKEVRKGELSATNTTASSFAFFSTACYSAVRNQTRSLSFSFSFSLSVGRFVSSIL